MAPRARRSSVAPNSKSSAQRTLRAQLPARSTLPRRRRRHVDRRHVAPEVLEPVVVAGLRREDVQHDVEVVGDDPGALALPVDGARQEAGLVLQLLAHLVVDRRGLARVAPAADDEEVRVDRDRPHVEDDDVLGELLAGEAGDALCELERGQRLWVAFSATHSVSPGSRVEPERDDELLDAVRDEPVDWEARRDALPDLR